MTEKRNRDTAEETRKERERENAEIDERFPIDPNDPPEKQEQMRIAREAAKMDP